jgi:hypothetical protein
MQIKDRTTARIDELVDRLEKVEDDLLQSIEADPALFRVPGVMDLTGQLKNALRSIRTAREAIRSQASRPQAATSINQGNS